MSEGFQTTTSGETQRFDKNLIKDVNDFHLQEGMWSHARNAINNSKTGDLGKIGNEPSNQFCVSAKYEIIGVIHLIADKWAVFSTDSAGNSEIGVFFEDVCDYKTLVNDPCLNFSRLHLIKGVSRSRSTCNFTMYWDDGNNPTRFLTFTIDSVEDNYYTNPDSTIPWKKICEPVTANEPCLDCEVLNELDCDKIRLAPFIQIPCIEVRKGFSSGTLLNGSYQVAVAYAADGQRISDWYVSNIQPLFQHLNGGNSLDVQLSNVDQDFDQILVAIVSVTNGQTAVRLAGVYNTRQQQLSFDTIDNTWTTVPVEDISLSTPVVDRTDDMFAVNQYLIRVGPKSKLDFNYQPLANQIVAKWQAVEYPKDYYRKGGNKTNYLRDEVYAFFIRWVYDTGDKSAAYHIPGRPEVAFDRLPIASEDASPETSVGISPAENWVVYNTATYEINPNTVLPDGGVVIAQGLMGYWESTEKYPDDMPEVWNANVPVSPYNQYFDPLAYGLPQASMHDLCGRPIRHHKFPDLYLIEPDLKPDGSVSISFSATRSTEYLEPSQKQKIRMMGVAFENIQHPVDLAGNPIQGIVGYEILRGTRNGNKTILAKGLVCNMRKYRIPSEDPLNPVREGAFPNYPYNDLNIDPFLSSKPVLYVGCSPFGGILGGSNQSNSEINYAPYGTPEAQMGNYYRDFFTFHSPDTNFTDPYLSAKEFKVHGEMFGDVIGKFELSEEHPREKLLTNLSFYIAAVAGLGIASLAMTPERSTRYIPPKNPGYAFAGPAGTDIAGGPANAAGLVTLVYTPQQIYTNLQNAVSVLGDTTGINGTLQALEILNTGYNFANALPSMEGGQKIYDIGETELSRVPTPIRVIQAIPTFFTYFSQGTDSFLNLIKAIVKFREYALRYHSHGYYDGYLKPRLGLSRRVIKDAQYVGPQITDFGVDIRVNNLFRSKTVAVQIEEQLPQFSSPIIPITQDITRILASDVDDLKENGKLKRPYKQEFGPFSGYNTQGTLNPGERPQTASSLYVSLKQRIRNQYGQINGIQQFPASCVFPAPVPDPATGTYVPVSSDTVFGGDVYLGRYTEKNTFFYFYNWLYGQPDGAQFDYTKNEMIPFPRYWANFDQFETGDFVGSIGQAIANLFSGSGGYNPFDPQHTANLVLPNDFYNLDGIECGGSNPFGSLGLGVRNSWFYLFNSGVKDFWVESEINVDLRDWGELETELHYDPYRYTDTRELFKTGIIKSGNYYKYDFSLSISKIWNNYVSWANVQPISYNPNLAENCFVYLPKRVIYSLPAQFESLRDGWRRFLPSNYQDFLSRVTSIKSMGKSGSLMFFENESPMLFQGVDTLQTENGVKFTIGDGGLFSSPMQNVVNVETPIEYGSCQNRYSVINTPFGLFWMSQNQGKLFSFQGGVSEISMQSLKWWLAKFLPYKLTETFPDFALTDNPVAGIGCQTIFDNENGLVYFCKKDFSVKEDLPGGVTLEYAGGDNFNIKMLETVVGQVKLGDPEYFDDASWTLSYDPKIKNWISFHDWHPDLVIPGKNTFMTVREDSIWKHNERCDSYCNFYGVDYPFEIEFLFTSKMQVQSLRSIEYYMEAYKYAGNCHDRFHALDHNFDEAVVYNTEQCSGLLKLNLSPKNDPFGMLQYPVIGFASIDILYSKEENKYRFNQFWDATDDRGEFNPNAERVIWNTSPNGYVKVLNPNNLSYNKAPFERKKFRHYQNNILLRKNVNGDKKILMIFTFEKNLLSPR